MRPDVFRLASGMWFTYLAVARITGQPVDVVLRAMRNGDLETGSQGEFCASEVSMDRWWGKLNASADARAQSRESEAQAH